RPRAGGRVLGFGCAALALVVAYSALLCRTALADPYGQRDFARQVEQINRDTRERLRVRVQFRVLVRRLGEELAAGRCTLREAADRVTESEAGRDPEWLRSLAVRYPDRP